MEKETKRGGVKFDHYYCRDCGLVWLDPGEIELYQLAFLVSEKGQEAERFKAIHANMTEDERTRLEQMISGISDASSNGLTNPYDG